MGIVTIIKRISLSHFSQILILFRQPVIRTIKAQLIQSRKSAQSPLEYFFTFISETRSTFRTHRIRLRYANHKLLLINRVTKQKHIGTHFQITKSCRMRKETPVKPANSISPERFVRNVPFNSSSHEGEAGRPREGNTRTPGRSSLLCKECRHRRKPVLANF